VIKVLVVDDDKLVRKGLVSAMPWSAFDMEVIGEANNGKSALEMLETHNVDLLLTDLAMPVMSGLELMRIARERYPELFVVVLTMHQDFEYIQEALRLGALDYIAKYQLEQEHFDEVLGRVHARFLLEQGRTIHMREAKQTADCRIADVGYVFLSLDPRPDTTWLDQLDKEEKAEWVEIELNAWIWMREDANDATYVDVERENELLDMISSLPEWSIMKLSGMNGVKRSEIHHAIRNYMSHDFFYEYSLDTRWFERSVVHICTEPTVTTEEQFMSLKEQWLSFEWIRESDCFEHNLHDLKKARLSLPELIRLLISIEEEWRRGYDFISGHGNSLPNRIHCWRDAELWLRALHKAATDAVRHSLYSMEVINCIWLSVKIVQEELHSQLYAVDVAKRIGLSRSYFSQCFKDVIGESFNEYLRRARVEKAKEYLIHTGHSIQWIAERTGYLDEKYFSRVFRDKTGELPSEYRQSNKFSPGKR